MPIHQDAEMEMPNEYVDMDANELAYDGGLPNWAKIAIIGGVSVIAIVAVTATIMACTRGAATALAEGEIAVVTKADVASGAVKVPLPPI